MQKIKKLSSLEARKIAAGEVVERPANIVKELVENSIDAGATTISIYIKKGGHKEIRVVDNGSGMSPEDAHMCFEHHATSKISSLNDLFALHSFGFRGEALSSIAAVSAIELQTKEENTELGIAIKRLPDTIVSQETVACNTGTSISIADIFHNVPARQKFLKKAETEWRLIVTFFQAVCLAHQSIHFKLYHDDKLIYNTPATNTLSNRFAQIAQLQNESMLELEPITRNGITISGVISNAHTIRYNKNHMFFFVNSRWVKNYKLAQAVLKGYSGSLPTNKHPLCALLIEIDPNQIDVNIHPRKEEIQFLHPKIVESLIAEQTKKALEKNLAQALHATKIQSSTFKPASTYSPAQPLKHSPFQQQPLYQTNNAYKDIPTSPLITTPQKITSLELNSPEPKLTQPQLELKQQTTLRPQEFSIIGVAHKTYILLEHTQGILMVDQHAAHERILLERFSKQSTTIETINLIAPLLINVSADEQSLLEQYSDIVVQHGIGLRIISDNQIGIVSTPIYAKNIDWHSFVHELLALLQENKNVTHEEFLAQLHKKIHAQMACKAAVKAGDTLSMAQIHQLLADLEECEQKNICAHGRPTSWLLEEYEIKKKFKRDYRS